MPGCLATARKKDVAINTGPQTKGKVFYTNLQIYGKTTAHLYKVYGLTFFQPKMKDRSVSFL